MVKESTASFEEINNAAYIALKETAGLVNSILAMKLSKNHDFILFEILACSTFSL